MSDGKSKTGAPGTDDVALGEADEAEAEAVGEAAAEDWTLSELSEAPRPQAVSSRPADTARAAAVGRVERVTSESPVPRADTSELAHGAKHHRPPTLSTRGRVLRG